MVIVLGMVRKFLFFLQNIHKCRLINIKVINIIFMIKNVISFLLMISSSSFCCCQQDYQIETFVLFNNIAAESVIMDEGEILKTDSLTIHSNSIFNISSFKMKIYKFHYVDQDSISVFKEEEFFTFTSNSNKITPEMKSTLSDYSCISKFTLYDYEIENKAGVKVQPELLYKSMSVSIVITGID